MAQLLSFKDATQPVKKSNKQMYDEFDKHLQMCANDADSFVLQNPLNQLKPIKHVFNGSSTPKDIRPSMDVIHQPIDDEFVDSIILTYDTGKLTHSDTTINRYSNHDWLFWLIDTIDISLNDKMLVRICGRSIDGLSKFMNTKSYGMLRSASPVVVQGGKERMSIMIPIKPNLLNKTPMYLRAGSKLSFKIRFNNFSASYFDGAPPLVVNCECTYELELLCSIPTIQFSPKTPVIDKTYVVVSSDYTFINKELDNKNTVLPPIPIPYGNLIAVVMMCSQMNGDVKTYPIVLNDFKYKVSGDNGFDIAQYDGKKREVFAGGRYLSHDNETPGTITIYFTEIDEFTKIRNINKTTFSKLLEKLLINIEVGADGFNILYRNDTIRRTIHIVQIVETYIVQ